MFVNGYDDNNAHDHDVHPTYSSQHFVTTGTTCIGVTNTIVAWIFLRKLKSNDLHVI